MLTLFPWGLYLEVLIRYISSGATFRIQVVASKNSEEQALSLDQENLGLLVVNVRISGPLGGMQGEHWPCICGIGCMGVVLPRLWWTTAFMTRCFQRGVVSRQWSLIKQTFSLLPLPQTQKFPQNKKSWHLSFFNRRKEVGIILDCFPFVII